MAWDPDSIASTVPVQSTTDAGDSAWDPDKHIDAAGKRTYGSFWDNVKGDLQFTGREAAIAARGAVQGLESAVTLPLDAGVGAVNLVKKGLNKLGLDNDPTYMKLPSQSNDEAITSLGVPTPTGPGEKGLSLAASMLAGSRIPQGAVEQVPGASIQAAGRPVIPGQTAGQSTGNSLVQSVESTLGRMPGGSPIRNSITQQKNNLVQNVRDTVDNLSGGRATTPYSVGANLDPALKQGAQDLKDAGGAVYDSIDALIPQSTPVKLGLTQKVLDTFTKLDPNAPATSAILKDPQLVQIAKAFGKDLAPTPATASKILGADGSPAFVTPAIAKQGLPYSTIKGLIQDLNQSIDWTGMNGNAANGALKQVYSALRQDLNSTASSVSPGIGQAVQLANKNWGNVKDRLDAISNAMSANGGVEQIFNKLVNNSKLGPSGLMAVLDHIPDSSQRLLAAGMLQRMGLKGGASGTFDADTFFQNWNKMDPDAKNRLFGSLPQNYQKNIEKIAENAKTLKAYTNVLPNASNTASAAIWGISMERAISALYHGNIKEAVVTAFGIPAATWGTAKLLTNPRIVQALARESDPSKVLGLSGAGVGASPQSNPPPRQAQFQSPAPWLDQ